MFQVRQDLSSLQLPERISIGGAKSMAGERVKQYENEVKITPGGGGGGVEVTSWPGLIIQSQHLKKIKKSLTTCRDWETN